MQVETADTRPRGLLRFVGASREELPALAWSFFFFFCLLSGYYVLRSVREAMIAADGTRLIPTVFTSVFFCMLALMPIYGAIVSRFPRRKFLPFVFGAVVVFLVGFSLAFESSAPIAAVTVAFAIFISVTNLFTDSVFWSFMSDIFVTDQAKRFYGTIAAGGTAGAIVGPLMTRIVVDDLGVSNLLLLSASFYAICLLCVFMLIPWARAQEAARGRDGEQPIGGSFIAGAKLVVERPFLFALVLHMFFGISVGTLLYNEQAAAVKALNLSDVERTSFFATVDLAINVVTLAVQLLLTRRLMVRFGVAPLLLIPAIGQVIGMTALTFAFSATLLTVVQIFTRGFTFSLVKPGRESLFTRVDRETRYKAKNFIDTAVYRGGDMTTSLSYQALAQGLGFGLAAIAGVWTAVACVWLLVVLWIVRMQRSMPEDTPA